MNVFTKQKQTHRHRKQTYSYQRGKVGGYKLGVWDKHIHTTVYKIDNKQRPTVQHNYTQYSPQYSVILGKNLKNNGYMYMYN